ncbi:MAG: hypothetical protein RI563_01105 [Thiohalophilus sp.]|uniref:hypothetical protein n=1 Tax=Thiohalophilus sp. TaxID=3028392 RepID=UPI00286FD241|nr:hypothetical protein [Thiohalophilus sp.]MDR9435445.1 hypothetical protein [Thiohalophilus sp.]
MQIRQLTIMVFLLALSGQAVASDCVEAVEHHIDSAEPSYSQVWLEWTARIRNNCDKSYYTLIRVDFQDAEGKRIHKSLTSSMVKQGDTVTLHKRALVDEDIYDRIESSEIRIDPEELPNEVQ